ncbi:MAG: tryptophan synthase alpha chain [Epulopiscium sp.]|jgi:tryptophan synthase alpha chain|uniref:Tryptophan synthase alpha chain n=1 Tax=Defluviitalea raffinosedens TaxID=1450156 RepID=A0A7C8LIM8_9FIRM|nr:tryptophan synthase subunit alpha [Defluviitalea raffinosedens]KAE9632918.1 tryptophan synthase subunit alpha [Defluviitalea raffinosedens]MBM7684612.1 tryptophan synthase alpha chain [Defluviitalea raffinosedens]MBZ4667347.1 tryptophan synthase subunit alpha [Defluviitaleaceae bacterium]MDK2787643.1 tryptophan synthase alpha chain [Candidatus Epulonipiscium sp.]
MNRIQEKLEGLRKENKKALITYMTAGDPNIEQTEKLIYAKERGGADIIEIGIPFSDPVADGPVIQAAAQRALEAGTNLEKIFKCIANVRKNTQIPIAFLVYYNSILGYGVERFIRQCEEVGVDGLVIPDLPLEEREEIMPYIKSFNIGLIPLVAPTSKDRIKDIVQDGEGFVYCISSMGVTGIRSEFHKNLEEFLKDVKSIAHIPTAVGFGFSSKEDIKRLLPYVDGVIVGSAIVKKIEESKGNEKVIEEFIKDLKSAY